MTKYYGRWDIQSVQTDIRGNEKTDYAGNPLRTKYLKGLHPNDNTKIRGIMKSISQNLIDEANASGWKEVNEMLGIKEKTLPNIANDPRRYTLQQVCEDIIEHLNKRRQNGKHHDLTKSFIDRHNYLVGLIVTKLVETDAEEDIRKFNNYIIDIVDPDTEDTSFKDRLNGLFEIRK